MQSKGGFMTKILGKNLSKQRLIMALFCIVYLVGIIGFFASFLRAIWLPMSGLILYLTTIGVIASSKQKGKLLLFLLIAFCIGFASEVIGVQTGILFGDYNYGTNLGFKFLGVPIVIGLLWGVLAVSSASCVAQFPILKKQASFVAALLMLGIDYIMEPVAIASDFWSWNGAAVPLWNYICWFGIAWILQIILKRGTFLESNKVFNLVFILLTVFFSSLNLYQ
ncbi:MAG: carotenoid biosynthesis protein [Crocinitomicaceae bacterium]